MASEKNELLFSKFGINYNWEPEMYKKGSVIFRDVSQADPCTTPFEDETDRRW